MGWIWVFHTWTVIKVQQVSKPLFIPFMDVGSLSSHLCLFLSSCVLVRDSCGVVVFIVPLENLLGCTKPFICFSSPFSRSFFFLNGCSLAEVRSKERKILERAGLVQSFTVGVAPIVMVISCVCTFTFHMALGYDLTAAEVWMQGNCSC